MTSRDLFLGLTSRQNESHKSVHSAFNSFYNGITLTGDQRAICASRRDDIIAKLHKDFHIIEAFATGSIPKYTALRKPDADIDVMVALHYGKHVEGKRPSEVLQAVRDSLSAWRTNVRKNGQAVTLHYLTWPNVDIVPVSRVMKYANTVNYYSVPDMNSESWIKSNPREHAEEIAERVKEFGPEFRRIIKMIKYWNMRHSEYLSSYHIEVLALEILRGNFSDYPWDVYQFFKKATQLVSAAYLWDGHSYVDSYLDYTARSEAVKRLSTAAERSLSAWALTYTDNSASAHGQAIAEWKKIFGAAFSNE